MKAEDKQALKQKITETLAEVESNIKELKELTKPIPPENSLGRITRMDAINNKSVNEAALRMAKIKLTKLQVALTKIDEPGFGKCVRCSKSIQPRRLMFMPESALCVRCAM